MYAWSYEPLKFHSIVCFLLRAGFIDDVDHGTDAKLVSSVVELKCNLIAVELNFCVVVASQVKRRPCMVDLDTWRAWSKLCGQPRSLAVST